MLQEGASTADVPHQQATGPKGSMLFGNLARMRDDPIGLLMDAAREHGDIAKLRLVFTIYLLSDPHHIKRVLSGEHSRKYRKGKLYQRIKPLVGEGLLSGEGDHWVRQRKLVQPAFRPRNLASYAEVMAEEAAAIVDRWSSRPAPDDPLDISHDMTEVTLRVIGRTMLGVELDAATAPVFDNLPFVLSALNERFQQLLYLPFLPTPGNIRFNRALGALERVVEAIIAGRRKNAAGDGDFLSALISARDEDGRAMTPRQLRDEVMTMLLAGHETTSNALSWTVYLLARNPKAQETVRSECARTATLPPMERVKALQYTRMAIMEAMRLYPPAWLLGRFVAEDDVIDGVRIPKGSAVFLSQYVTHRHPAYWEDPEAFEPLRFLEERAALRHPFAYFPFSGGPRNCIGERFAVMEAQLILAAIMSRFRAYPVPGRETLPDPSVTLRPKNGVIVRLERT